MLTIILMFARQADVHEISGEAYVVFGIILFFWELLPTSLVVVFFRVQRPNQNLVNRHSKGYKSHIVYHPELYLFDAVCLCKPLRLQEG